MTQELIITAITGMAVIAAAVALATMFITRKIQYVDARINFVHERIGDVNQTLEQYKDVLGAQKALMEEDQRERAIRKEKEERSKKRCLDFYNGVKKRQSGGETLSAIAKSMGIRTKELDEQMKKIENVVLQENICVAGNAVLRASIESNEQDTADEEKA